jgi:cytochrome c-type biogenesis protein CcmH/NrfG
MDWLDRLSLAVAAVVVLTAIGMLTDQEIAKRRHDNPEGRAETADASYAQRMEADRKTYQEVASHVEQGLYKEAMAELKEIVKEDPERSLSYVYMARVYLKQGNLADGTHNYRHAVEIEPGYVDKKTPLFLGDELTKLVAEGREKFGREQMLRPNDKGVKRALEDIYYLQRRLAGGCE